MKQNKQIRKILDRLSIKIHDGIRETEKASQAEDGEFDGFFAEAFEEITNLYAATKDEVPK